MSKGNVINATDAATAIAATSAAADRGAVAAVFIRIPRREKFLTRAKWITADAALVRRKGEGHLDSVKESGESDR